MKRPTPLSVAAALVVTALVAALVAVGTGGADAAPKAAASGGTFRHALAVKLGEQLHKPTADVLAALRIARPARPGGAGRAARLSLRAKRLAKRAKALQARAGRLSAAGGSRAGTRATRRAQRAGQARAAWAAALAKPLDVSASEVTAALRALVAERLGALVSEGWITTDRRDAELACFDDAARCRGMRPPGPALLRAGR